MRGDWLFTTRPGAEGDLVDELRVSRADAEAKVLATALVRARAAPTTPRGEIDLAFARQGFPVTSALEGDPDTLVDAAVEAILALPALEGEGPLAGGFALLTWAPDSDEANRWAEQVDALDARLRETLEARGHAPTQTSTAARLVQVAMIAPRQLRIGQVPADIALSSAPGGRDRMRVGGDRPSRAARKVEEALSWLGVSPGNGEVCIDLGAAPGGWSWCLLQRRAKVIAVDPAELRPDVAAHRGMVHVKASAFQYAPDEPADWLFCDMAWRPLEAAQLLAKFARRGWARMLVANLKLPMKTKAQTLEDLRSILLGGGWQRLRVRQLYHDREEVTVTAYRG